MRSQELLSKLQGGKITYLSNLLFHKVMNDNLWVLIPAFNEERAIKEVVARAKKQVSNVLIVNDGSTDKTSLILSRIKGVEVINIAENSGKANAVKIGVNYLKSKKAEKIITLDADLQHLPEEIPNFLKAKGDIIIGTRSRVDSSMPITRRLGNFFASLIINLQTGVKVTDPQSGFRLYNNRAVNSLSFDGNCFNIEKTTLKQAVEKRLSISEVPISCIYNNNLRSSYFKLKDIIEFLRS
ncbi:MAG: glycosyltransferase family 2 protein [Nanoarchaeota archaeon]|nr:glycosyltransferase family 2 protein [Nanoarchaeota archaeon]